MKEQFRQIKKMVTVAAVMTMAVVSLHAGDQALMMLTGTNVLNAGGAPLTNFYAVPRDVTGTFTNGISLAGLAPNDYFHCDKTTVLNVMAGGYFGNTNATVDNKFFRLLRSTDLSHWQDAGDFVMVSVPARSTNWYTGTMTITAPYTGYVLRQIDGTNITAAGSNTGTNLFINGFTHDGQ